MLHCQHARYHLYIVHRIIVEDAVDWRPHDKIVLSSSSYEPHEAEVLTVKEVKGHHVRFHERLKHRHIGKTLFKASELARKNMLRLGP